LTFSTSEKKYSTRNRESMISKPLVFLSHPFDYFLRLFRTTVLCVRAREV
jgi:hypothetical protein